MKGHAIALGMSKDLEAASDSNLVFHFTPELEGIARGERALAILPEGVLRRFIELGVLENLGSKGHKLSDRGKGFLQNIKDAKTTFSTP